MLVSESIVDFLEGNVLSPGRGLVIRRREALFWLVLGEEATGDFGRRINFHVISISKLNYQFDCPLIIQLMSEPKKDNLKQYLPVPLQKQRYFTLEEVSHHNSANDCWITLFGEVYDLTRVVQEHIADPLTTPLIQAAGTDITYWFDSSSR